ncbi:helix-turn-helix transcriptional regulator [Microlunatus ginsengisoli]|uniref:helix-turn-helix transcriptional regulator n=1 Tax=Microlunatus ginsengisoli TaxID=363863 RepID=UPI0031DFC0EC
MTAELPTDWWTTEEVATFLGVSSSTIRSYLARGQMPEPDRRFGRLPAWRPATIRDWNERRPRKALGH